MAHPYLYLYHTYLVKLPDPDPAERVKRAKRLWRLELVGSRNERS
jgi:hypothetical protein